MSTPRVLVVAATARELPPVAGGWAQLVCGVGPVEAAAATAAAITRERPSAIVHVGIGGARASSGLVPPALVIGDASTWADLGVGPEWAPHHIDTDPRLVAAAQRALPHAARRLIGTSARVGGCNTPVEAMEGFAVLRAAQLAGVPAVEVRAISNLVEESDRGRWMFDAAFQAITAAVPHLVAEVAACAS